MSEYLDDFDIAYQRALSKFGVRIWAQMSPEKQTAAIFEALHLMRLERSAGQDTKNGKPLGGK